MFSDNGKISEKQLTCMVVMPVLSAGLLVLPHMFAAIYGENILNGAAAFFVAGAIYVALLFFSGLGYRRKRINGAYKLVAVIDIVRNYIRLIFFILLSMAVLMEGQVPFIEKKMGNSPGNMLVLLPLVVVAFYGAYRGLEETGRLHEMLIGALLFPYIIMILFGIKEMDYDALIPVSYVTARPMSVFVKYVLSSIGLLTFIVPAENYLRLKLEAKENDKTEIKIYLWIILCLAMVGIISLIIAGIYGVRGAGDDSMVSVAIMRYIELPLGVLQRFDMLMVWFFMTGCFILMASAVSGIKRPLDDLFRCMGNRNSIPDRDRDRNVGASANGRRRDGGIKALIMLCLIAAAMLTAMRCPEYDIMLRGFIVYGALVDVPLSLILPIIRWLDLKRIKKFLFVILIFVNTFILNGCSGKIENIEQRDYATILMVTLPEETVPVFGYSSRTEEKKYHFTLGIARERKTGEKSEPEIVTTIDADSLKELFEDYGRIKGKDLSLSHLKILLVGYDVDSTVFMGENLREFIYELDEEDEVARTCPMLFVQNVLSVEQLMKSADKPVGTYLDSLVDNAKREGREIPKIMDYLKSIREGRQIMIYELRSEGEDMMLSCKGTS